MRGWRFLIAFSAIWIAGCSDSQETISAEPDKNNSIPAVERTVNEKKPLVSIGSNILYDADVEEEVALRRKLALLRNSKTSKNKLETMSQRLRKFACRHYIDVQLSRAYLQECRQAISAEAISNDYANIIKSHGFTNLNDLFAKLSREEVELMKRGVEDGVAIKQALSEVERRANIAVKDEEVQRAINRYTQLNDAAIMTNTLIYARGTNIWQKIKSQIVTFEEAAFDFTEMEDEADLGGSWGRFSWQQLASEKPLRKLLKGMKIGDFTPPIECDNGLCIVKLCGMNKSISTDEEDIDGEEGTELADCEFELARIFLRLPIIWEIPPAEEMRQIICAKKKDEAVTKAFSEIEKKLTVRYYK